MFNYLLDRMTETQTENQMAEEEAEDQTFQPPLSLKIMVGYLYFLQGVVLSIPMTMTLVYAQLPLPKILSVFAMAKLPFSFKFVTAPLIEKYTFIEYGKRKTWIIFSQIFAFMMMMIGSLVTDQSQQIILAIIFILVVFFISLQDIALDAVAIKQLRIPYLAALLQGILQTVGIVVGGLMLLKFTSSQFSQGIGLHEPITTPSTMLRVFSLLIIIPTVIIHYNYNQRILQSERKIRQQSLINIIKYYRVFFQWKTRHCRTFVMFLLYYQGFNFFQAYYDYELVNNYQFSRNTLNTIGNSVLIPIIIISVIVAPIINQLGWLKTMMVTLTIKLFLQAIVYVVFPTSQTALWVVFFLIQLLETLRFILTSTLVNQFPVIGVSGMFITMLNSGANFGRLDALHIYLTGLWGWDTVAFIGLVLQGGIITCFPSIFEYVNEGEVEIKQESQEQEMKNYDMVEE